MNKIFSEDLADLLNILPPHVYKPLVDQDDINSLLEVVMDLGRPPSARFPGREIDLSPREVIQEDIDYVTNRIGEFGDDNRAGIERTLHRISAIRNRAGKIVGITCRAGRAVFGTIKVIEDLVQSGKSVLLLGRPGVGKTTMLREVARVLADYAGKRVIVVDTSNEIAGDGDIPHPAIGRARRMQVETPSMQHAVMIEAVENHMPEVIVIDEIGTELEALAARTIAERGVQLVGTAHGNTLQNLLLNPTLADLIGGIQAVTLSDEEAKRRGTQKTILERKSPPTFNIVVEIQDRNLVAVHADVTVAVDGLLLGQDIPQEIRSLDENGDVKIERIEPAKPARKGSAKASSAPVMSQKFPDMYLFGVNREKLEATARELHIPINIVSNLSQADILVTSKTYYQRKPQKIRDAESSNIPIYVLRKHSGSQFRQFLLAMDKRNRLPETEELPVTEIAIREAEEAVSRLKNGEDEIELSPRSSYIRRLQHLIADRSHLTSQSVGSEPKRRVRITREAGS
ncbi:MAG: AAA family ATPase [Dehalococcoidales bacterium]|nr:AAA family ATPase [Dehalococcoidales bacterium]MDD4230473.1 AAA family ATPase [Dehalococcoidales bacterium]MDD4465601.1 AAA family ATPase [Dehalococcoidales bacterium]MDD5402278.1 AAA family ATPase [Dehalococcoidales bacterium]